MFNPLNWLLGLFSLDIGIDLGTANTLVYIRNKGIVINEPSWVAFDKRSKIPLAIGAAAKHMYGRTPPNVVVIRPLRDGPGPLGALRCTSHAGCRRPNWTEGRAFLAPALWTRDVGNVRMKG